MLSMFKRAQHAPTFDRFSASYIERVRRTNKSGRDDDTRCRLWLLPVLGTHRLDQITPRHCADVLTRVSEQRAPATANRVRALLRRMLTVACADGHLTDNPARWLQHQREPAPRDIVIPDADFARLLSASAALDNYVIGALFQLCLLTGRRVSEWRLLQWQDVDLTARMVRFADTKAGVAQRFVLAEPVHAVLHALPRTCAPMHGPDCTCGLVLPGRRRGLPLSQWSHTWRRVCSDAGVAPFVLHGTRHNVATRLMAQSNLSDAAIAMLLGHQSINTTRKYLHVRADVMRSATEEAMRVIRPLNLT